MSVTWSVIIVALLFLSQATACRQEPGSWERIQESGILRVGLDPTYPPFAVSEEDNVTGIDVDLARAIAEDLGLEAKFTFYGYDGLYDALTTSQVDILASALVIDRTKLRDFSYTTSYFNAGQVLVSKDEALVADYASLDKGKLAVELGAQGHVEATKWRRKAPGLIIIPHQSVEEALKAVDRGDADVALVDHIGARLYMGHNKGLLHKSDPITDEPFAIVLSADEVKMLEAINGSIDRLFNTNQIQRILDQWFDN